MLAHPHLPPGLIERCLDVLHKIVPSDRELIRIVVEIIIELHDNEEADAALEDDVRCLPLLSFSVHSDDTHQERRHSFRDDTEYNYCSTGEVVEADQRATAHDTRREEPSRSY